MAVDDDLRVAWWAQRGGRGALREAMLTLAIAESGPGDGWAERCRARLLAERPGHFLGSHPTLEKSLADPRVAEAVRKLRAQYPPGRVGWLRFRAECESGPFTGEAAPLAAVIESLVGPPAEAEVRRDAPEPSRGPRARVRAAASVGAATVGRRSAGSAGPDGAAIEQPPPGDEGAPTEALYLAILLAIAMLLAGAEQARAPRAA